MRILFANKFEATVADGEISLTFRLCKGEAVEVAREGTSETLPQRTYMRACGMAKKEILNRRKRLVKEALKKLEQEKQHTFDF